jgi:glycosyltransferase involved in cell wall biosynthesis
LFDVSIGRNVLPHAARLLAVSEAERVQLQSMQIAADRIRVIPNPIDLGEFEHAIAPGAFRRRAGVGDRKLIVFLGKLTPRKRVDVVARAFAKLADRDARLIVAGNDMGYGAELDRIVAELAIGDRTLRPGLLVARERLEVLADADVVVYPSKDEIFGLVPIEALLCGTPVVVADDSGCGEVISGTHGGLVVAQGDAGELARAITVIIDEPDTWRAAARRAADRVREWYAAPGICAQLEAVYEEVVGAPAARVPPSARV